MKQFKGVAILLGVSFLVIWVFLQAPSTSSFKTESDNLTIKAHAEAEGMPEAAQSEDFLNPVTGADVKIAPVFDATGVVVSDPSGTLLNASHLGDGAKAIGEMDVKIAPLFDTTGAVVSDPTGTLLNASHSGNMNVPLTNMDIKIAPVFDGAGEVVSDPTGTILSVINR